MEALSIKEIASAVNGKVIHGNKEVLIRSVTTNSKDIGLDALFVPIIGERLDGHDYIDDAIRQGALACFISKEVAINNKGIYILVDNTLDALQALGSYYRDKIHIPIIGITGSVGKTTTKELIASALETKYRVFKTEGNMNSQIGLPLMVLKIEKNHEIAVIEMGMSEEGEMVRLSKIAKPNLAVITNIGVSHIAWLKTKENIRKEKLNIINEFLDNSVLYVNGNDDLLHPIYCYGKGLWDDSNNNIDISSITREKLIKNNVVSYGVGQNFEFSANNIRVSDGKTYYTLHVMKDNKEQKDVKYEDGEEIELSVLGTHNVYNSLVALAIAEYYNVPIELAKKGLSGYKPISMRGQIKKVKEIYIIDDTYNASPDSMKSGIEVLLSLDNAKRRIAVLADVKELGELSQSCHYDVGTYISKKDIYMLVTIGREALHIANGVMDNNKNIIVHSFDNNEEAIKFLKKTLTPFDGVLIKGSRSMKTDEIVRELERN